MEKFKFLEHTADVKFQAYGKSLEEAFVNSSLALKEVMFGKIKIKSKIKKKIKINAKDNEGLLYRFLEQFLYLLDAENFVFNKVKIKIKDDKLEADVVGDKAKNYKFTNNVKAVTYNQMFVKQERNKFITQVVVDV
ncbi:MAG: archease [Nanoarchaeota archaeon]|nr:archease [Nanoarchaeota archaeon]